MPAVVAVLHRLRCWTTRLVALVLHRSATTCNPLPKWSTLDLAERRAYGTSVQLVPPNSIVIFNLLLLFRFPLPILIPLVLLTRHQSTVSLIYYFAIWVFAPSATAFAWTSVLYRANSGHRDSMENQVTSIKKFDNSSLNIRAIVRIESYIEVVYKISLGILGRVWLFR